MSGNESRGQSRVYDVLHRFKFTIAILLVTTLVTASAINISTAYTPSNNITTYNKNTGLSDYTYLVFNDGTNIQVKNGTTGAIEFSGTDAATVLNQALSKINTLGGGSIYVKGYGFSQPYNIKSALIIPDNGHLKFVGDGPEYTVLKIPSGFDNNLFEFKGTKTKNSFFNQFRDFLGEGNKGTGGVNNTGFFLNAGGGFGISDSVWNNVFLENFKMDDMYINGTNSWNNRVESSTIEHAGRAGIYRSGGINTADFRVTNSKFLYNDQYGVFDGGVFATYADNWFYRNNGYGMWLDPTFAKSVIIGNRFQNSGYGANNTYDDIHAYQPDYTVISNNVFFGSENGNNFVRYGLWIDQFSQGNEISGNVFSTGNFGSAKIYITPSSQTTSRIHDNAGWNPVGVLASPISSGNGIITPVAGNTATPAASTDYIVRTTPILLTSTGGTGVSITIKDSAGNTVSSGASTLSSVYIPIGYKVNFGAFSVAPTLTVAFN